MVVGRTLQCEKLLSNSLLLSPLLQTVQFLKFFAKEISLWTTMKANSFQPKKCGNCNSASEE